MRRAVVAVALGVGLASGAAGQVATFTPDSSVAFTLHWAEHGGNGNGVLGDAQDEVLSSWSLDPILAQVPLATTRYGVEVRCSSLASCQIDPQTGRLKHLSTVPLGKYQYAAFVRTDRTGRWLLWHGAGPRIETGGLVEMGVDGEPAASHA